MKIVHIPILRPGALECGDLLTPIDASKIHLIRVLREVTIT